MEYLFIITPVVFVLGVLIVALIGLAATAMFMSAFHKDD